MPDTIKFTWGDTNATPASLRAIEESGQTPAEFLDRHVAGDWGYLDQEDCQLNDLALTNGDRIFSAYRTLKGVRIWIITEAADDSGQRPYTTILLPEEY